MNVQEYISSGIVESYVLGLASPEERTEFEKLCLQYPELALARNEFEMLIEKEARQGAVTPPRYLREKVHSQLLPGSAQMPTPDLVPKIQGRTWWNYAAVACVVMLAGSLIWNISQYNRNIKLQASYDAVVKEYDSTTSRLVEIEDEIAMIRQNPNLRIAAMKGMNVSPQSFATVYWDTLSKDVYLLVNNLPQPANDKQYQLWALLDGKPVDMGMIGNDAFIGEKKLLIQMKNASAAQAFAITLEKKGGNPTPEGDMYVMGNL